MNKKQNQEQNKEEMNSNDALREMISLNPSNYTDIGKIVPIIKMNISSIPLEIVTEIMNCTYGVKTYFADEIENIDEFIATFLKRIAKMCQYDTISFYNDVVHHKRKLLNYVSFVFIPYFRIFGTETVPYEIIESENGQHIIHSIPWETIKNNYILRIINKNFNLTETDPLKTNFQNLLIKDPIDNKNDSQWITQINQLGREMRRIGIGREFGSTLIEIANSTESGELPSVITEPFINL